MRRLVRWTAAFLALSGAGVWWVADRGNLALGDALLPGIVLGGLITVAFAAAVRTLARRRSG